MTPRSIASRLLENDEDFDVHGEINRLTTSLHPNYEIESEGNHWNIYLTDGHHFIGEITYDDMADMPRETMTPEQITMWDANRWMASAGFREEDRKFCASFKEAFLWVVTRNAEKRARNPVRESEDPDDPAPYTHPDQFTKQPSYEKIESDLRVMLRPYYDEVHINRRPHKFAEVFKGLRDYYRWTIHCRRSAALKLPSHGNLAQWGNPIDWRQQTKTWFHDWSERSDLHLKEFEIHGRLRVDPTFQFTTWRLPENGVSFTGKVLKEDEDDDLTPEQFLAHHVDKQEIKEELLEALWKWHPSGVSYNALVGPRMAIIMVTLYFPPEKNDFYLKFVEFVKNWITNRKLFPVTVTKLTGGPHYPYDSNYPRWGLTLAVNMDWPSDTPAYTPAEASPAVVPTGQEP